MGPILPIYCSRSEQLLVDVTAVRLADLGYHHRVVVELVWSGPLRTAAVGDGSPELPEASRGEPLIIVRGSGGDVEDEPPGHVAFA